MEEVQRLLSQLGSEAVVEGVDDKLFCIETKDGIFSVQSMYKALWPRSLELFPWLMADPQCQAPRILCGDPNFRMLTAL